MPKSKIATKIIIAGLPGAEESYTVEDLKVLQG
jgi:hypothetical protein